MQQPKKGSANIYGATATCTVLEFRNRKVNRIARSLPLKCTWISL